MAIVAQQQCEGKENKEDASENRAKCRRCEEQIRQNAASEQGSEIENRFCKGQLAPHFVDGGKREDDKHPDRAKEETQNGRQFEGVKGGVIVVEHPRLGDVVLNAGIE